MAKFKGVTKQCEVCSKEFRVPQSQAHVRTCSKECGYQIRRVANKVEWVSCRCEQCGNEFKERPCHAERRRFCSDGCRFTSERYKREQSSRISGQANPGWKDGAARKAVSETGKLYYRSAPATENARLAKRRAAKLQATPKWADLDKVRLLYAEAQRLSMKTGTPYHVDHIVPLSSKKVCGLHCESNLQILPGEDNLRKGNRFN